jgi:hypothetical protein
VKKVFSLLNKKVLALSLAITGMMMQLAPSVFASNPFDKAGVSSQSADKIYTDLKKVVQFVIAIGGFWVLVCIIFAGVMLASSNGNAQRRTAGLMGLAFAMLGGWVILKANTIAGWIVSFGA